MSYGFYRVSKYNLIRSEGHSRGKRFLVNFLEMNAAAIVPVFAYYTVDRFILTGKKKSKFQTGFSLSPTGASIVVRLK